MKVYISTAFSFIATGFMWLVGGFDLAFKTLAIVMLLDYITGVISAIYKKKVNSKIGFKGILKKSLYFIVIILASIFGLYGIFIGLILFLANLSGTKSFNKDYLYPYAPIDLQEQLDGFIKKENDVKSRNPLLSNNRIRGYK